MLRSLRATHASRHVHRFEESLIVNYVYLCRNAMYKPWVLCRSPCSTMCSTKNERSQMFLKRFTLFAWEMHHRFPVTDIYFFKCQCMYTIGLCVLGLQLSGFLCVYSWLVSQSFSRSSRLYVYMSYWEDLTSSINMQNVQKSPTLPTTSNCSNENALHARSETTPTKPRSPLMTHSARA